MENEGTFEGVGGLNIRNEIVAAGRRVRGIMILIHGFNSHSGYLAWPAEQFAGDRFCRLRPGPPR